MNALLLIALLISVDVSSVVELTPDERDRAGIVSEVVEARAANRRIRVVGEIVRSPGATQAVRSLVEGRIERIDVAPGDRVRVGDPLLLMHSHTLHQLQAELLQAVQELKLAETRLAAGRQLFEIEGIARVELERREQEAFKTRLAVEAAKVELHDLGFTDAEIEALSNVDTTHPDTHPDLLVRAPVDGVVLELPIAPQTWIQPWETLLVLGNPEHLELALQLTPGDAEGVRTGDRVDFSPVGQPECECIARVVTRVPQVDPETRTVTIRAAIESGELGVLPGVFVEGNLESSEDVSRRPFVPESALTRLAGEDHVFVVRDDGGYEARSVRLGRSENGRYEIVSGLEPGERLVTEGVFLLKSKLVRGEEEG